MDIPFVGKECEVPIFSDVHNFRVGVFAGNLHTTTSAYVPAKKSILCGTGDKPIVPKEDAYDKMMEDINADAVRAETAANKAEEKLADMQERYYTPSVNEDGDLSWEANDEGMPEVPMVNIKGVPGDKGDKGDAGISPTIKMDYVADGHKLTITDVNGTQVFTVYDGKKGDKGDNADNDELFVVRKTSSTTADKTYAEIETAIAEKRAVLMVDAGKTYSYVGTDSSGGLVFCRYYESTNSKYPGIWEDRKTLSRNNVLDSRTFTPAQTPNPFKLKLTGAVSAEYNGSEEVTVEIPEGGGSVAAVNADWGENDESSPSFVKNRTHYEAEGIVEYLPLTSFMVQGNEGMTTEPLKKDIEVGKEYIINLNGVDYVSTASEFDTGEGFSIITIGNMAQMGGEDTGEPFLLMIMPNAEIAAAMGFTIAIGLYEEVAEVNVSIKGKETVVKKIDNKYLPMPNWNAAEGEEGYIENRTHYTEYIGDIIFDGNNELIAEMEGYKIYKISDKFLTAGVLNDCFYYFKTDIANDYESSVNKLFEFDLIGDEEYAVLNQKTNNYETMIYSVSKPLTIFGSINLPSKGTYIIPAFPYYRIEVGTAYYKLNKKFYDLMGYATEEYVINKINYATREPIYTGLSVNKITVSTNSWTINGASSIKRYVLDVSIPNTTPTTGTLFIELYVGQDISQSAEQKKIATYKIDNALVQGEARYFQIRADTKGSFVETYATVPTAEKTATTGLLSTNEYNPIGSNYYLTHIKIYTEGNVRIPKDATFQYYASTI